jgi:hypothetical protein
MQLFTPKAKDLGDGFVVRRALPQLERRSVGPFIFLDEMGPVRFAPGQGLDVRPHPHIGLSTVTYLFDGAIEHRDSLGTVQVIVPGDVNWMTAGSGIVHSERSPSPRTGGTLHGIQFWLALPQAVEETAPAFHHTPAADIPLLAGPGWTGRLLIGSFAGATSPVQAFSPTFYLDLSLEAGASLAIGPEVATELAVYVSAGAVMVGDGAVAAGELGVAAYGAGVSLRAEAPARLIVFGGAPLDGPRKLFWNFVSSRPERIEAAKAAWEADAMGQVPGETERIPLPG